MGTKDFLFIGHRTSGKSTLGSALSERGWRVIDIDLELEAKLGAPCSVLLNRDEHAFRASEDTCVQDLVADSHETPRIIVCGAGMQNFPDRALAVWIHRDGWEVSARRDRTRLRPDLSWEDELDWMITTREDRYAQVADLKIHIPQGRRLERTVDELEDLLNWVERPSPAFQYRTFIIASQESNLSSAEVRVQRLGVAGLEIRSDLTPNARPSCPYIASLRHPDPEWLVSHPDAIALDIDLKFLDQVLISGVLEGLLPRRLILSSHAGPDSLEELKTGRQNLPPNWVKHVELKFAPHCGLEDLHPRPDVETYLPQGDHNAWFRLVTWQSNSLNFLPLGIKESRGGKKLPTPLDLQDWIPSFGETTQFDALLGYPVEKSQGDWWHRRASVAEGKSRGYVKIPCPAESFRTLLRILPEIGVVNLSITTPLKSEAASFQADSSAVNTLKWKGSRWFAIDTDEIGMLEVLESEALEGMDKSAVLVGSGDVTDAIKRALTKLEWEWRQVRGRGTDPIPAATLLINATGRPISRPYSCHVHLDLHYDDVAPSLAVIHLNGDTFFEAQARAQRRFWFSTLE